MAAGSKMKGLELSAVCERGDKVFELLNADE